MPSTTLPPAGYVLLYEAIDQYFFLDDLKSLCFDLGIEYQNLPGDETRIAKARELVAAMEQRGRTADLLERLQRLRPNVDWLAFQPAEPEAEPPFKGLRYYDEKDAPLFFGREQLTAELVGHLRRHHFLAVVGASGSGKSSLVRAGVVPAVRRGEIGANGQDSGEWPVHIITPGDEPLKTLAASLTRHIESVTAAQTLLDDMQRDGRSLDLFLRRQPYRSLLLVLDQFEELFTQCRDAEVRRLFVENLVQAAGEGSPGRLALILTLRADFYAFAVELEPLRPLLETRQKIVGAMTADELCQAIQKPAEAGDWRFQPGLVDTMLADVGAEAGSLPLLSHALLETWRRRQGRVMTLAGYREVGGVRGAITKTADAVYQQFDAEQQAIARRIFLRLTELGEGTEDTRRRAHLEELLPPGETAEAVRSVLTQLADARLVTTDEASAEVSHEALIREWPALRQWLNDSRDWLRLHRQLTADTREWEAAGQDADLLYRGAKLAQAAEWVEKRDEELSELERAFVRASLAERDRVAAEREVQRQRELAAAQQLAEAQQRRVTAVRRAAAGLVVLFLLALVAAVLAVNSGQRATQTANSLATEELNARTNAEEAGRQATAAFFAQDTAEAERVIAQAEATRADQNLATAVYNEQLANTQFQIAQSQALAAAGQAVGHFNDMRALLLAIEAARTYPTELAYTAINQQLPFMAEPLLTLNHEGPVTDVQWNGDASYILTLSAYGKATVWNADSGELLLVLSQGGESVTAADWNEEGNRILSFGRDGVVRVWDVEHDTPVLTLIDEGSWITAAEWNKDESRILTGSRDGTVMVWNAGNGAALLTMRHEGEVTAVHWNEDENRALTVSSDGAVKVWDTQSGYHYRTINHEGEIMDAHWSTNGNRILTYGGDHSVKVWDAPFGNLLLTLSHEDSVLVAQWNTDNSRILTASNDGMARVWNAQSGELLLSLAHRRVIWNAEWNKDGSRIVTASDDRTARIWNAQSGELLLTLTHDSSVNDAQWNRDESLILTASADRTAKVWDVQSGNFMLTLTHDESVNDARWNGDESLILTASADRTAKVWDAQNGNLMLTLDHGGAVNIAQWNRDESLILTASSDGKVTVWDAQTGSSQLTFSHDGLVNSAQWDRDERRIVLAGADGLATVWDVRSRELLLTLPHADYITSAQWNGNGSQILTSSWDGTARVWDGDHGDLLLALSHAGQVNAAQWNEDESRILTAGEDITGVGVVQVWDAESGASLLALTQEWPIRTAQWNEDESRILTASEAGTAGIWDARSGEILFSLTGDGTSVTVAHWNRNGGRILLGTAGGLVRIYYSNNTELLDVACQAATRNLTWEEWRLYLPGQDYHRSCPNLPVHPSVPQP